MSANHTTREVIESLKIGIVNTPTDMSEFYTVVQKQLKSYNVPPAVIATILSQCTNATLEVTIKTLELNNVQID